MAKTQGSLVNVLLALIGLGWLTATDRLDKAEDFVRIKIATALTQAKSVIPVLIDDMPMRQNIPRLSLLDAWGRPARTPSHHGKP